MATTRILSIKRADGIEGGNVLINLSSSGSRPLDLHIAGTEGRYPYTCSLTQDQAAAPATGVKGDKKQWLSSLSWILLGTRPSPKLVKFVESVEVIALVTEARSIELSLRQNICGITQKLGTITLLRNDNQAVELFDWTDVAARSAIEAEHRTQQLQVKYDTQQIEINKLKGQLQDLIQAKREHETELLEKLRHLLNAKKLKIRDQQRLLAASRIDTDRASQVTGGKIGLSVRATVPKPSKRKNRGVSKVEPDVDDNNNSETVTTRSHVHVEPESEDDVKKETPDRSADEETEQEDGSKIEEEPPTPPPKRDLPFGRKADPVQATSANLGTAEGDDTDDEL